ncbi:5-hydroxytryptamine receptor 2A-like, partial [Pocillopora damicornis]
MYSEKPLFTKLIMSGLTTMLTLVSACCNGFVIVVVARFKSLRTVPNILLSNHALVDLANAIICVPLYTMYTVLEARWFRGKTLAIMTSFFDRVYIVINLTSLLAMIVNIFLAISYDMKYSIWKSNRKALLCVFLIWLIGVVFVIVVSIPLLNIDLGNAHVTEYRAVIYEQGKYFVASFMAFFIISVAILGFLTTRAIKSRRKKRAEMNLSPLQAEVRLKRDIRACKTIAIIIATNFFAHVPAILFAVVDLENRSSAQSWLAFFAVYIFYLSSALNPIIYCVRNSRLQSALRQFLKDPLGSRDFRENAVVTINARTMSNDDRIVGTRDNRVEHACASELDPLGGQTRRNNSNDQKDEEIILSINRIPIEAWPQINGNNTEHRGSRMPRPE